MAGAELPERRAGSTTESPRFMENQIRWHYFPMSDQEYERAVDEVRAAE